MTDISQQHGAFSWCELMTTDTTAAKAFYTRLFGWTIEERTMPEMTYNVMSVGNKEFGGLMQMPPGIPAGVPPRWGVYVTVDDVDATAKLVVELGGEVMQPPVDIDASMRFALIKDPQGAMLSIISYRKIAA
jgi:uncharacterized protein